ncbi:MAG TPA: hypothetical protein VJS64_09080 [Pyrinomonadaceae bacterium]|nr:hypothetical protein [Pyrinomonadaceae bacterium]
MKRIILVVLLVTIAALAGIVRSYSKTGRNLSDLPSVVSGDSNSQGDVRDEIRKTYELAAGARVQVEGINGAVKIETSDTRTAEIYIERTAKSAEALQRRKIVIENTANTLKIRGEKGDVGLISRIFGSSPNEKVTLKLPRQISLVTQGVNGAVTVGEIDGPVEVHGVNGKVDIAQATGSAEFHGINGNISVALTRLEKDAVSLNGVNGNIELRLADGINVELEAHGMNGRVSSDLPDFVIDEQRHGNYHARVGSGGNSISANGINGSIRLIRIAAAAVNSDAAKSKA